MAGIAIVETRAERLEFFKKLDDQPSISSDNPKALSCRKLLRSSQWSDIPDLASCMYAGSSPQKGETSHPQECGALRTDHSRGIEDVNHPRGPGISSMQEANISGLASLNLPNRLLTD